MKAETVVHKMAERETCQHPAMLLGPLQPSREGRGSEHEPQQFGTGAGALQINSDP